MPLSAFHPIIQKWFSSRFESPSPPQSEGWPHISAGKDTLIAAPTGTGKTLTAFMACIDSLFRQALDGSLKDETQVVYVSPLKALSNDIEKNLREPLKGIYEIAAAEGLIAPEIKVTVRTGDTLTSERQLMLRRPPHILVTTPESLYILLTAEKSREKLRNVRTVIVDEIHAVAKDKRGAHLALTLERLGALCEKKPQRIGLSATQRPIELVAEFLTGTRPCHVVNLGHLRKIELSIEVPGSPLEAVCSHETWSEIYDRLTTLINANRTTLIFVNTRKLCERLALHLTERLGEEFVSSHHGSLSRAHRLKAEERLKSGQLKVLVATSSLELGIDIGNVDLVCQIGNTSAISALLQRVGRSGHSLTGISRGKLFVLTIDELMTAAALHSSILRGNMDILEIPPNPRDILAQQIVAETAAREWNEDELFGLVRRAYNYRNLERKEFDEILAMLADGFTTRRGRRGALIHYDGVGKRIRGRRGARLAAITSGGAIPDNADYAVIQDPQGIVVGSLNEDYAVESTPGDIFQLGNMSWKILKIEPGKVRVEDAHGQPPSIPFWLGEAPARTDELSLEVSRIRKRVDEIIDELGYSNGIDAVTKWLAEECGLERIAAEQLCAYLVDTKRVLGTLPTHETLILERFFDEAGGMQLILHAPLGRRVMWGWGLAMRKRFCRGFNFELQAAATENALLLSLGTQHSFPLADVFHYLNSKTYEELLIQAMLVSPTFQSRWRWDAGRALALLRFTGGKKVPPQIMRMRSDDLLAAVFPHAAACPETLEGDRDIPDHPLVRDVIYDCLHEAMDTDQLRDTLQKIERGELKLVACDTVEPSKLAHEILTTKPYAFLDEAPLEERRTLAVMTRRGLSQHDSDTIGALDSAAIERVREECRPEPREADDLHDAFMTSGYLAESELQHFRKMLAELVSAGRATKLSGSQTWLATERVPLFEAIFPEAYSELWGQSVPRAALLSAARADRATTVGEPVFPSAALNSPDEKRITCSKAEFDPAVVVPAKDRAKSWTREDALVEILRGRLEMSGPVTAESLASHLGVSTADADATLVRLETQGMVLRGHFTAQTKEVEWCDRRLLARIHRYTLDRLRREIEPVAPADFMRFLFHWQHADPSVALDGPRGVADAIAQLQGYEISAVAWERDVLPARVSKYDRRWLDQLSLSGEITWGRRFPPTAIQDDEKDANETKPAKRYSGSVRHAPIGLFLRDQFEFWLVQAPPLPADDSHLSGAAKQVLELLRKRGAVFFQILARETKRLPVEIETALGELVACGYVTGDGFAGLRALLTSAAKRAKIEKYRKRVMQRRMRSLSRFPALGDARALARDQAGQANFSLVKDDNSSIQSAGRWSLFRGDGSPSLFGEVSVQDVIEKVTRQLLRRWGVLFHRLIARETGLPPWIEIVRFLRRLEARGEVRGGRFVDGFSGEQYALPEAVEQLRKVRKRPAEGHLLSISGADPLNLVGIITPGERVPARASSRIVFRDGVPVATKEAGLIQVLQQDATTALKSEINAALIRKAM